MAPELAASLSQSESACMEVIWILVGAFVEICYPARSMIYAFDQYELDLGQVELRYQGNAVAIEPQVFALLCLLIENRDRMVSKDEIIEKIWDSRVVSDSALTSRVKSARRAVGDDGDTQRIIRTVRGRGFRFVAEVEAQSAPTDITEMVEVNKQVVPETVRPSIAVLPFQWLGKDNEYAILADALPYELITALSRLRWLAVIARGSSFRFRMANADIREIGKALNVSYCVSGLVEVRGRTMAVTIELIDTRDNNILWGDQFTFKLDDVHDVRAQIVANIVAALEIHIPQNEANRARLTGPESLDAWSEYHLGLQAMYRFNKHDNAAADLHFHRAINLDPGFARAHAGLSFTSFQDAFLDYSNTKTSAVEQARRYAERSVELDPLDPFANFTMGRSFWLRGDVDSCIGWLDRSITLSPNFAQGIYSRGWADAISGRGLEGRARVDEAIRLSPLDPLMYAMFGTRALSHIAEHEFDAAVPWAEKGASAPGSHILTGLIAVVAYTLAGNDERANYWADNIRQRRPDISKQLFFESFPFADEEMRNVFDNAFKQHGM